MTDNKGYAKVKRKWINTAINANGISMWQYVDGLDAAGYVSIDEDTKRVAWGTEGGNHGTARNIGQGKRAVQKLVK